MATDGVKIIDGDLAHDVYYTFMDLYDGGRPLAEIKADIEQMRLSNDDFYDEIFITAYALALWEIGEITPDILEHVKQAIERGAFVKYLVEWHDGKEGKQRQQVLDRFWQKLTQVNPKVRKRKSPEIQKKFVFNEGDVLTFQMQDGTYRATILLLISQHRGRCSYEFAMPTYSSLAKPALDDVRNGEIMGSILQPKGRIGFNVVGIGHKDLRAIADKFELIGHLEINPSAQCCGTQGGAVSFESFASSFSDFNSFLDVKMTAKTHPNKVFSVQKLF
jgi:hypothetical protein